MPEAVLGGLHAPSWSPQCRPHADALVLGDGVQLWPRILADVESGCPQSEYTANHESDNLKDGVPRLSLLSRKSLLATTSLIATRRLSRPVRVLPTASER